MTQRTLLTSLLSHRLLVTTGPRACDSFRVALAAEPVLAGRVRCDDAGIIELTGANGSAPPGSLKERERWELHVRLRLEAELGHAAATTARVRWAAPFEKAAVASD